MDDSTIFVLSAVVVAAVGTTLGAASEPSLFFAIHNYGSILVFSFSIGLLMRQGYMVQSGNVAPVLNKAESEIEKELRKFQTNIIKTEGLSRDSNVDFYQDHGDTKQLCKGEDCRLGELVGENQSSQGPVSWEDRTGSELQTESEI
jgi:hypothetical protein